VPLKFKKIIFSTVIFILFALLMVIILGDNGLVELLRLRETHQHLAEGNAVLTQENIQLYRMIDRLQNDPSFVEDIARHELGMIRSDEIIFKFKTTSQAP
jgi:cell division protein FtsB